MKVEKPKKPKDLSYVLKTSLLERVLREAGVEIDTHLIYWIPENGGSILEAFYWLPNENVSYPRLYMRAGVVPNEEHRKAFELLQNEALPAFARWLTLLTTLPDGSTLLNDKLYFNASYIEGHLKIETSPINKSLKTDEWMKIVLSRADSRSGIPPRRDSSRRSGRHKCRTSSRE